MSEEPEIALPPPSRIAAGFFHNLVVSNVGGARAASRGQGGSSAGSPSAASRSLAVPGVSPTTAVYGFGSNRHQVLGKIAADVA
mmetsp:Transcript_17782/g.36660  ORF Transcript_17782/g.36660 Transcript_17782/m.36660 type:complete len:84 (+) Transcript_17782:98-349(+)